MNRHDFEVLIKEGGYSSVYVGKDKKYYFPKEYMEGIKVYGFPSNSYGCYEDNGVHSAYITDMHGNIIKCKHLLDENESYGCLYEMIKQAAEERRTERCEKIELFLKKILCMVSKECAA